MRSSGRDGREDISEVDTLPLIYPIYMYICVHSTVQYSTVDLTCVLK